MKPSWILGITFLILFTLTACTTVTFEDWDDVYDEAVAAMFVDDDTIDAVTEDLNFINRSAAYHRVSLTWESDNEAIISNTGEVNRPTEGNALVTLTIFISTNNESVERTVTVVVLQTEKIELTFVSDEGVETMLIDAGTLVDAPTLEPRKAVDFVGWFLEGEDDPFDFSTEPVIKSATFTAVFEDKTYTITFDSMGGSEVESIEGIVHSTMPETLETPTKEGYEFIGWIFIDAFGNEQLLIEGKTIVNHDIHAEARWVPISE